jgi:hypothetical protein
MLFNRVVGNALGILAVAGCGPLTQQGKADALAEHYETEMTDSPTTERCNFAGKVAEAYLDAGDGEKYRKWAHTKDIDCLMQKIDESVGVYGR